MIETKEWPSNSYYFNKRTGLAQGGFITDGGAAAVTTGTYTQSHFDIKNLQTVGSVTGFAQAVTRELIGDLKAKEMQGAVKAMAWNIETAMLWGNATATANGSFPEFDGLDALVNTYASGTTQNAIDEANQALSLSHLDNLIDMVEENISEPVVGSDWMMVMSPKANSKIASLQVSNQRYMDVDVAVGLNVQSYRDIPIIRSTFLAPRSNITLFTSAAASSAGGTIGSSVTTWYAVAAVIQNFGELQAAAAACTGTASNSLVNSNVLTIPAQTAIEGGGAILYKVYSGTASTSLSLLGIVDATDTAGAAVTNITDTGTNLLTNGLASKTGPTAYVSGNTGQFARGASSEDIFLIPRNPDYALRPCVRDFQVINLAPTTSAPDTLPFAIVSDCTFAVRGPKYLGRLSRVVASI
jgi:hypothetical protein